MKSSCMMLFPAIFLLFMTSSCGTTPDKARMDLERRNVPYDGDAFVRQSGEGDAEAVKRFLDAGMDPNATDRNGETALVAASRSSRQETVEVLLVRGAKVDARDDKGRTALWWTRKFQWKENRKKTREILRNAGAPPEEEGR